MVPLFSRALDLKTSTVHMPVVGSAATHSQTCAAQKQGATQRAVTPVTLGDTFAELPKNS